MIIFDNITISGDNSTQENQALVKALMAMAGENATEKERVTFFWQMVRKERNKLLRETDYTQLSDVPLTNDKRNEFKDYRKALRDLPQDTADPYSVVFPTRPAE